MLAQDFEDLPRGLRLGPGCTSGATRSPKPSACRDPSRAAARGVAQLELSASTCSWQWNNVPHAVTPGFEQRGVREAMMRTNDRVDHSLGLQLFGTNVPASNALWKPSSLTGFATLQSRIGHRNSGLCVDSFGNAFDGIGLRTFNCDNRPSEIFFVGVE